MNEQHQPSWTGQSETESFSTWAGPPPYNPGGQLPRHAAEPAPPAPPKLDPTGEPVVISHAVTVILGALVTAGWVTIPDPTITTIGTVLAIVLSTVGTILARARVSPVKGGIWGAIGGYVADLVRAELAKYQG